MPSRRARWILQLLAVLMSFGGSPASWAQVFAHVDEASTAEHCLMEPDQSHHESLALQGSDQSAAHSDTQPAFQGGDQGAPHDGKGMSCCDQGACGCASSVAMSGTAIRLPGVAAPQPADFILPPDRAEPVGQLLRPPRS